MLVQPQPLSRLFAEIPVHPLAPEVLPEQMIQGIAYDSRSVQPGDLFVALQGGNVDGHAFIAKAVASGAAAIIGTRPLGEAQGLANVPYVQVPDGRAALAHLSAAVYGFPGRKLTVIGVTGTDGKTTTSTLIYQILLAAGLKAGMISTVNALIGEQALDTGFHVTTPEAPEVQHYLAQMVTAGLTHVVLESTSHGLAQDRVSGAEFDAAVVTNITHEHLDYHGTYEAYRDAKARLLTFTGETRPKVWGSLGVAVLNQDDSSFEYLRGIAPGEIIAYSLENQSADVHAQDIRLTPQGSDFTVVTRNQRVQVHTHLAGSFNISNCMAAAGLALEGLRLPAAAVEQGIAATAGVPGRMEYIDLGQVFTAIVDFAHTPNALQRALETARELTDGRILCVFGSAGLRDRQKRRMMAEVSVRLADITYLTAEDPRTEELDGILEEMASAASQLGGVEGMNFFRIRDRGEAIRAAVRAARPGDLVMACGKGHEQSMCFGVTEYAWDDRTAMRAALSELLRIPGPELPYLPTRTPF